MINRDFVPITLFMAAVMLAFVSQIQLMLFAGAGLCAVYAYAASDDRGLSNNKLLLVLFSFILFLPAFVNFNHGLSPLFYLLSTVSAFFAAMAASSKPPIVLLKAFSSLYFAAVVAIVWILFKYWGYPEPFGMVIEGSSTNGIPVYFIVLQLSLSLATYLTYGRLPVLSTVLTFAVAFFGNGRSSLVVAGLIILATLILNVIVVKRKKSKLPWLYWSLLTLVIFIGVVWGDELLGLITVYTKLSAGLVDSNRLDILHQYSQKINVFTLFFGADYSGTVIENEYLGNPHIAYIRTHSLFGLPATILAIISPTLILLPQKVWKTKLVFFIFISLAALRSISEPVFFPTLLDFFYFTWFLMYFKHAAPSRTGNSRSAQSVINNV